MPEPQINPAENERKKSREQLDPTKRSFGAENAGNKYPDPETGGYVQQDCFATAHNQSKLNLPEVSNPALDLHHVLQETNIDVAIVTDGVGSAQKGANAARLAVIWISQYLKENCDQFKASPVLTLERAIKQSNQRLIQMSKGNKNVFTTTIAITAVDRDQNMAFSANVGDSNTYLCSEQSGPQRRWGRLSKCDTLVARLVELNVIPENEAATHPRRNIITQTLGDEFDEIHINQTYISPGDRIVAMTDGVEDPIQEDYLAPELRHPGTSAQLAQRLINKALEKGRGKPYDNMACCVTIA